VIRATIQIVIANVIAIAMVLQQVALVEKKPPLFLLLLRILRRFFAVLPSLFVLAVHRITNGLNLFPKSLQITLLYQAVARVLPEESIKAMEVIQKKV
jgi:hypothetical protein